MPIAIPAAGSGGGGGGTGLPNPTAPGQIMVSTGAGADGWDDALTDAATPIDGALNPDTEDGSEGTSNTFALGDHSHPRSALYADFGRDTVNVVTGEGNIVIPDTSEYQANLITLTDDATLELPDADFGKRLRIAIKQGGIGGFAPTFPANVGWAGATPPAWSTDAGLIDTVDLLCLDGLNWFVMASAIGVATPPPPIEIVQEINSGPNPAGLATLAEDVQAGNSVLALIGPRTGGAIHQTVTGGGCTWAMIGEVTVPDIDSMGFVTGGSVEIWLGTNSTGAGGNAVLHFANGQPVAVAHFMEITPVILDSTAGVVMGDGPVASGPLEFTVPAVTASQAGEMPIIIALLNEVPLTAPGSPWTQAPVHKVFTNPTEAFTGQVMVLYQTNTVLDEDYDATIGIAYNHATREWASASFLLKPT